MWKQINRRIQMSKIGLTLAALCWVSAQTASAQDVENGEKVFKKCKACHQAGEGAKNRVGPFLTGVVGRAAGTVDGYKYSKYMVAAGESVLVWDADTLFDYLAGPSDYLKTVLDDPKAKAKMAFKLKDEEDRRDVIAYLATFSEAAE